MHIRKNKFIFLVFILLFFSFVSATSYGEKIVTDQYEISRSIVERNISPGTLFEDFVEIKNLGNSIMGISISFDGKASELIKVLNSSVSIMPGESKKINFLLKGTDLGEYDGNLFLSGNIQETLPVKIVIGEDSSSTPFLLDVSSLKNHFDKGKELYFKINIKKLKKENLQGVIFDYFIHGQDNLSYDFGKETFSLNNSYSFVKEFPPFENLSEGKYIFEIISSYGDYVVSDRSEFFLETPFFEILVFGIFPMKYLLISAGGLFVLFLTIFLIKKRIKGKKKYKMNLDLKSIPKKNEDFLFLGKIAEMNHPAFLDPNRLTTHSIVAGATGGGKSISAQVIIEELLKKNIAVIVFDPTAQWSGMLRKCTTKKMMDYYFDLFY